MKGMTSYYTIKEAAELLKITPATIYKYIREGKLRPILKGSEKMISESDIENIKLYFSKPGLTTGEAATFLGVHPTTVYQLIKTGVLKAEKKYYRGKRLNFLDIDQLDEYKNNYILKKGKKSYIDKDTGYVLFQQFINQEGIPDNRIMLGENGKMYLYTYDHKQIPLNDIKPSGFSSITSFSNIGYITKRGHASFVFQEVNNHFLSIIDLFYKHLGTKNMNIYFNDHNIHVEVKPIFIEEQLSSELYTYLVKHLHSGDIKQTLDGFFIEGDLDTITIAVSPDIKEKIKKIAKESNSSMEDVVVKILNEYLKK